jgi:hypothetical protein
MEPEGSLLYLQEPVTCPCPELDQSTLPTLIYPRSILKFLIIFKYSSGSKYWDYSFMVSYNI